MNFTPYFFLDRLAEFFSRADFQAVVSHFPPSNWTQAFHKHFDLRKECSVLFTLEGQFGIVTIVSNRLRKTRGWFLTQDIRYLRVTNVNTISGHQESKNADKLTPEAVKAYLDKSLYLLQPKGQLSIAPRTASYVLSSLENVKVGLSELTIPFANLRSLKLFKAQVKMGKLKRLSMTVDSDVWPKEALKAVTELLDQDCINEMYVTFRRLNLQILEKLVIKWKKEKKFICSVSGDLRARLEDLNSVFGREGEGKRGMYRYFLQHPADAERCLDIGVSNFTTLGRKFHVRVWSTLK